MFPSLGWRPLQGVRLNRRSRPQAGIVAPRNSGIQTTGRDILQQFLLEAATLSLSGGAIGVVLGVSLAALVSALAKWNTMIEPSAVLTAFGFSTAIGLFFGYYPARRASQLEPIDALRYE